MVNSFGNDQYQFTRINVDYDKSTLKQGLKFLQDRVAAALLMYANTKAPQIEATMKMNRPWTDRTGMAKATLNAKVSQPDDETIRITLAHGVDYGIWLELAHEKNYAIIAPTVQQEAPKIENDLAGLFNKIKI